MAALDPEYRWMPAVVDHSITFLEKAIMVLLVILLANAVYSRISTIQVKNSIHDNEQVGFGNRAATCKGIALQYGVKSLPAPCFDPRVKALYMP